MKSTFQKYLDSVQLTCYLAALISEYAERIECGEIIDEEALIHCILSLKEELKEYLRCRESLGCVQNTTMFMEDNLFEGYGLSDQGFGILSGRFVGNAERAEGTILKWLELSENNINEDRMYLYETACFVSMLSGGAEKVSRMIKKEDEDEKEICDHRHRGGRNWHLFFKRVFPFFKRKRIRAK